MKMRLLLLLVLSFWAGQVNSGCGEAFDSAAAALLAPSPGLDCSTARLLVHSVSYEDFEGMGSILHSVLESAAEAFWSKRILLWGPAAVAPLMLRNLTAGGHASPLEAFFEPFPGRCDWGLHVHREEAKSLPIATSSARVRLSHPRRGGPGLFKAPRRLARLLGEAVSSTSLGTAAVSDAIVAECWGAAVARAFLRPRPWPRERVAALKRSLTVPTEPFMERSAVEKNVSVGSLDGFMPTLAAIHMRVGDVAAAKVVPGSSERVYSNKEVADPRELAQLLAKKIRESPVVRWPAASTSSSSPSSFSQSDRSAMLPPERAILTTDAPLRALPAMKAQIAEGLGWTAAEGAQRVVVVAERFRTDHGSHTYAFTPQSPSLLLPWHVADDVKRLYADANGAAQAAKDQDRVRIEALEDLLLLASADFLAGSATSHFSVVARLIGIANHALLSSGNRGLNVWTPPAWHDLRGVVSGELANGFMHGLFRGQERLKEQPWLRMQATTRRLLDWPVSFPIPPGGSSTTDPLASATGEAAAPLVSLDPTRGVPIIPDGLWRTVVPTWQRSGGADEAFCRRCRLPPARANACQIGSLVNSAVAFAGGEHMNPSLGVTCWKRALMMPGVWDSTSGLNMTAEFMEVARENALATSAKFYQRYSSFLEAATVRGEGPGAVRERDHRDRAVPKHGLGEARERAVSTTAALRVHVEGWRGVPHSFSVVTLDLVAELASRRGVEVSWSDAPLLQPTWATMRETYLRRRSRDCSDPTEATPTSSQGGDSSSSPTQQCTSHQHDDSMAELPSGVEVLPLGARLPTDAVVFRMAFPFRLTLDPYAARTVVFAVAERLCVEPNFRYQSMAVQSMAMAVKQRAATTFSTLAPSPHAEENMPWSVTPSTLVVPSMWSAEAFFRAGVPRERVAVAAHGVDTNLFRPARDASEKLKARVKLIGAEYFAPVHEAGDPSEARYETIETKRGNKKRRRKEKKHGSKKIWQERVVFLHVGAMTPNKGVPALLDAFSSVVASWTPSSVMAPPLLVLKGLDELYSSSAALDVVRDLLQSLLRRNFAAYIGGVLSRKTVGELFRAADVYVTASRSEGFGLPIAEAAASGLAVIAPAGGAVEEITDPSFTKYVESQIKEQPQESHDDGMSVMTNNGDCVTIKASMSHLVSTLEHVTKDQKFRQKASVFARNYALRYLSLEHSTDVLLGVLQDDQWASG